MRGEDKSVRSSPAAPEVRGQGGAPGARAEITLQPLEETMVVQRERCKKTGAAERNACVLTVIHPPTHLSRLMPLIASLKEPSVTPGVVPRKGSRGIRSEVGPGEGGRKDVVSMSVVLFPTTQKSIIIYLN